MYKLFIDGMKIFAGCKVSCIRELKENTVEVICDWPIENYRDVLENRQVEVNIKQKEVQIAIEPYHIDYVGDFNLPTFEAGAIEAEAILMIVFNNQKEFHFQAELIERSKKIPLRNRYSWFKRELRLWVNPLLREVNRGRYKDEKLTYNADISHWLTEYYIELSELPSDEG